jgi:hypothetical protein
MEKKSYTVCFHWASLFMDLLNRGWAKIRSLTGRHASRRGRVLRPASRDASAAASLEPTSGVALSPTHPASRIMRQLTALRAVFELPPARRRPAAGGHEGGRSSAVL